MAARKNIYERQRVAEAITPNAWYDWSKHEDVSFLDIQNEVNNLISRGCDIETIRIGWCHKNYDESAINVTLTGERDETEQEHAIRIEAFERRSAAAKAASSNRTKRQLEKARGEYEAAAKTMKKLAEKFGEDILTD